MHWIGAQVFVCVFFDSRDKTLNVFSNVSGFYLHDFRGLRVKMRVP